MTKIASYFKNKILTKVVVAPTKDGQIGPPLAKSGQLWPAMAKGWPDLVALYLGN